MALARAELQPEQHLLALQRQAPGDQDALGGLVGGAQLQIDRVQVEVDEIVAAEVALAPRLVALAGVLADPRDRRLRDHVLAERLLQQRLDVTHRQASEEAEDDQRLQRVRARDTLAEHLALEPQLRRVAHARALELHRPARRLHHPRLVAVAVDRRAVVGARVALAAEELGQLVLERLLHDQPRAQARDRFDRIIVLCDTGQHLIELAAQPLTRDYLRHAGVPPMLRLIRTKRRLRPHYVSPASGTAPSFSVRDTRLSHKPRCQSLRARFAATDLPRRPAGGAWNAFVAVGDLGRVASEDLRDSLAW